jgi:hypothetical protein
MKYSIAAGDGEVTDSGQQVSPTTWPGKTKHRPSFSTNAGQAAKQATKHNPALHSQRNKVNQTEGGWPGLHRLGPDWVKN